MMTILLSLYTATDRYLRLQIDRPQAKIKALADHRALFEAFKAKRSGAAAKLIKAHISGAYEDVMAQLKRNSATDATGNVRM